jgi:hypothetical protein
LPVIVVASSHKASMVGANNGTSLKYKNSSTGISGLPSSKYIDLLSTKYLNILFSNIEPSYNSS